MLSLGLLFIFLLSTRCRKDKLEGDKGILEGKWTWIRSTFNNPHTTPSTYNWYPQADAWITMEFFKKGKINIEFNDHGHYYNEPMRRIKFEQFTANAGDNSFDFAVHLYQAGYYENIQGKILDRTVDTLIIYDLPIADTLGSVSNYYIKQ